MTDQLVAYVLGHLDDTDLVQVEAQIDADPVLRRQADLLRQALEPLAIDRDPPAPPSGLVVRAIGRVAEHACQRHELPKAPEPAPQTMSIGRSWWSRADVLMAACLLIAVLGLGIFGLYRLRGPDSTAALIACQNNLKQVFDGLHQYHQRHNRYPDVTAESAPRNVAGMVLPILADAGMLPQQVLPSCPGAGPHTVCNLTLAQLRNLPDDEFALHKSNLIPCYAYCLGFRGPDDRYHPASLAGLNASQLPLMADAACQDKLFTDGNSANHGGGGQNVLFADGSVRFITDRILAGDDIFLNRNREVHAGLGFTDNCLGASDSNP